MVEGIVEFIHFYRFRERLRHLGYPLLEDIVRHELFKSIIILPVFFRRICNSPTPKSSNLTPQPLVWHLGDPLTTSLYHDFSTTHFSSNHLANLTVGVSTTLQNISATQMMIGKNNTKPPNHESCLPQSVAFPKT
jgi:hypothetical protein